MTRLMSEFKRKVVQYEMVPSDGGRFEITLDNEQIYSKLQAGQFPDESRIIESVKQLVRA